MDFSEKPVNAKIEQPGANIKLTPGIQEVGKTYGDNTFADFAITFNVLLTLSIGLISISGLSLICKFILMLGAFLILSYFSFWNNTSTNLLDRLFSKLRKRIHNT